MDQAPATTPGSSAAVTAPPSGLGVPVSVTPDLMQELRGQREGEATAGPDSNAAWQAPRPSIPAPPSTLPEQSPLVAAWPRSAQLATAFLLGVATALLVVHCLSMSGGRPADLDRAPHRVDLNRAPVTELQQVPGVGPKLAERIDGHRRAHGSFRTIEDLRKVPGIGAATLERLREFVAVEAPAEPAKPAPRVVKPAKAKQPAKRGKKEASLEGVMIDVNRASAADLQRLPSIGPKLSERIVDARTRGRFTSVNDLRRVPGIGPKTLEKLRPYITTGGGADQVAAED